MKIRRMLEREREELTVARRQRGSSGSGDHGEGLPADFGGDGVLDGVQLEQAKATVSSKISRVSCKREERRLELGVLVGELWARRRSARRRGSGKRHSYQRIRRLRRPWWQSFQRGGAPEPREFFVRVPAADSKIQV
jgi:hypothetical protein